MNCDLLAIRTVRFTVCDEMKLGFMMMLAGTHTHNYGVYQTIADSMKVGAVRTKLLTTEGY